MKTKQFLLLIVAATFVANVFATDVPKMSIVPLKDTKALITIQHSVPHVSAVTITDNAGNIVYYKKSKVKMDTEKKIYDLSQLDNGNYHLTLKAGTTTVKNDLQIKNGMVSVIRPRNQLKPYFASHKDKVILTYLNSAREEMNIKVYNANKLVFSKDLGNDLAMHRLLDVKALKNGHYDVLLADNQNKYWFSFSK